MKKTVLLHSGISRVVSNMGHCDTLTIADCGLPVPAGVERIDLAVKRGIPSFFDTFDAVMSELCIQKITIAKEASEHNKEFYAFFTGYCQQNAIHFEQVPHEEFKMLTQHSVAVIRTGECRPYSNVILESGVAF